MAYPPPIGPQLGINSETGWPQRLRNSIQPGYCIHKQPTRSSLSVSRSNQLYRHPGWHKKQAIIGNHRAPLGGSSSTREGISRGCHDGSDNHRVGQVTRLEWLGCKQSITAFHVIMCLIPLEQRTPRTTSFCKARQGKDGSKQHRMESQQPNAE